MHTILGCCRKLLHKALLARFEALSHILSCAKRPLLVFPPLSFRQPVRRIYSARFVQIKYIHTKRIGKGLSKKKQETPRHEDDFDSRDADRPAAARCSPTEIFFSGDG